MPSRRSYRSPGIGCSSDFSGIVTLRRPEELEQCPVIDRLTSGVVVSAAVQAQRKPLEEASESRFGGCDDVLTDLDQTACNCTLGRASKPARLLIHTARESTPGRRHRRTNDPLRRLSDSVPATGIALPSMPWLARDVATAARCPTTLASELLSWLTTKGRGGLSELSVQR